MKGDKFDVERAEECLAQIFNDSMVGDKSVLRLGASVCDFVLERYRDHTQSIQAFVGALKVRSYTNIPGDNPLTSNSMHTCLIFTPIRSASYSGLLMI